MNKQQEALKLALEALKEACEIVGVAWAWRDEKGRPAIATIREALAEQPASGSFTLWENTLCNPLADMRTQTQSAWHDGYASAKAELKALAEQPAQQESEAIHAAWMAGYTEGEREAIEKQTAQEQDPVAWRWVPSKVFPDYVISDDPEKARSAASHGMNIEPLYTSPPASKPWVGLTDEDKAEIENIVGITEDDDGWMVSQMFTLTETKLKEKNT